MGSVLVDAHGRTLYRFTAEAQGLHGRYLPAMQEKFVETYRAAGGPCDYRLFENATHEWVAVPGPQTDLARETLKAFIARQLRA